MIQYFQLTPDILLEYIYEDDPKLNEDGIRGNIKDIYDDDTSTLMLKSNAFGSKYLCFKNEYEGLDSFSNLVLPLNNTETQFVVAKSKYQNFFSKVNTANMFSGGYIYEDTNYDADIIAKKESCDVKYDKCILHFTSRNYFGSYDSLIFQAYVYMSNKAKLYFASFLFKKTSNLELKADHLLYNEKLYTTQAEFDIPSVFAIFTEKNKKIKISDGSSESDSSELYVIKHPFVRALESQNIELLQNTPIGINVYGVSGSVIGTDNYERLKTLKINSIFIPYAYNRLDDISVKIYEACDNKYREDEDLEGDFYYINPEMSKSYSSFADYIKSMGESVQAYMVMHELYLREVWVDNDGKSHSEITHKEFHIIDINDDDDDDDISKKFDAKIKYRPICIRGGKDYRATIIDTIKIINTVNNSSYEVTGSLEILNPYKYGKRLKRLAIKDESRPIVNVYNKKTTSSSRSGSGSISGSFSGSFSGDSSGSITGTIKGNIPGFGSIMGSVSGSVSDNSSDFILGSIKGSISGKGSVSGVGGSVGTPSGDNSGSGVVILNKGGGFVVENMTQNITSFIECTNIGVSIVELSPDDIN